MTTDTTRTSARRPGRRSTGRPAVLGAGLAGAGAAALVCVVAGIVTGSDGLAGAGIGAGVTLATFFVGAYVVDLVATAVPAAALGAALLIFTSQVAMLGLFLLVMSGSGLLDHSISRTWLGVGVIVVSVVWVTAQFVVTLKQRIPAYDLPPEPEEK